MLLALGPLNFKHGNVKALLGAVALDTPLFQADLFKYLYEAQKLPVGSLGSYPFVENYAQVTSPVQSIPCNAGAR